MNDRGTGRTAAQLTALPDGAVFVVAHRAEFDHCRRLLAQAGRRCEAVYLVTLAEIDRRLRGLRSSTVFDIDHAAFQFMTGDQRALLQAYRNKLTLPPLPA